MTRNSASWIGLVMTTKSWWKLLYDLLDDDVWAIRPFHKIREHPCWIPILEMMRADEDAVAILIGYLENFDVLGQWSLILLPMLTGENPVPAGHRDDLFLELSDWLAWAERNEIEP